MPPKKKVYDLAVAVPLGTLFEAPSTKTKFVLGKQFATGGFGRIHICKKQGENNELVVKVEPYDNGPLFTEVNVFQRILKKDMLDNYMIGKKKSRVALPWMIAAGTFDYNGNKLRFMVIPKYETSLEAIREKNGGKLSASDSLKVVATMLDALEYLHHNANIKAANILLEKKTDMNTAILVDFGLARMVSSNVDKPEKKRAHNGTAIFTSIDAHRGCNPSYRGDVEILAYNIIFWITGKLPWQPLESSPEKVYAEKQAFVNDLKAPTIANTIKEFFNVAMKTEYTGAVDFSLLRKAVATGAKTVSAEDKKAGMPSTSSTASNSKILTPRRKTPVRSTTVKKKADIPEDISIPKVKTTVFALKKKDATEEIPTPTMPFVNRTRRITRKRPSRGTLDQEGSESLKENQQDKKKTKIKTISPSLKKNAEKLRQNVPGLRNFPKGRRSIIVTQIAKKYQKIAALKSTADL